MYRKSQHSLLNIKYYNYSLKLSSLIAKVCIFKQKISPIINMSKEQEEHRKYFSLIQRVGSWHKYQYIILVLMCLINTLQSAFIFILPYLLHQQSYTCTDLTQQNCTNYVCSLGMNLRSSFLTTQAPFFSLTDQLGDYRCQLSDQVSKIQSLTFFGGTIGLSILSCFTESIGRKTSLMFSMLLTLTGFLIIYFSTNILMLALGLIIGTAGIQNAYQYTYCYSSEVVSEDQRIFFVTIFTFAYGFGIMINSFTFYYFKDWRTVFLWFYLVPTIVIILGVAYFIEKTPIDLLSTQKKQEIMRALNRIAKMNKVQNHNITENQIEKLQIQYQIQSDNKTFSALDLCRFASLRKLVIPLVILNFTSNYLFYAPSFIQKGGDLFMDNIISALSYFVATIISNISLNQFKRRDTSFILTSLIVLFAIFMLFPFVTQKSWLKSCNYFIFRLIVSVYLNNTYILNFQTFPTQIRASAGTIVYISGQFSGVVQPWAISIFQKNKIPINYQYIFVGIISFIVTIWMKQTFEEPPPEIIQQLQHKEEDQVKTLTYRYPQHQIN